MLKPLIVWITTNCGKFLKRWQYQTSFLLGNLYAGQEATVRTRHGTLDVSKLGKEYVKDIYCHLAYLTYIQSTPCEMLGSVTHKLDSRLPQEISITSDMQMTQFDGRKLRTKKPLDESERGE